MTTKENDNVRIRNYLLKAKLSDSYFTVAEYFKFIKKVLNIVPLSDREVYMGCGLKASSICADRNIPVGSKPHEVFNKVNTYPEKILAEVIFGETNKDIFPSYSKYLGNRYPFPPRKND